MPNRTYNWYDGGICPAHIGHYYRFGDTTYLRLPISGGRGTLFRTGSNKEVPSTAQSEAQYRQYQDEIKATVQYFDGGLLGNSWYR